MSSTTDHSEIAPLELKQRLNTNKNLCVLDIREPMELAICKLEYTLHIPMGELVERFEELEKFRDEEIIVYCRSGHRSFHVVEYLRSRGFKAQNLTGGILAWSQDVDPSVRMY